ncbi:hypothetical protein F2Q69_00019289 [Brassica cretica]|uniref:Uncharacterized protein n=1 Tax=Brassica cretica TaxID=69181 RepID=A0A8S9QB78_BRACR|nr:hypothetical protein F2Q69_00019289 [Brassica cretica]
MQLERLYSGGNELDEHPFSKFHLKKFRDNQALVVDWREASSLVLRAAGSILPLRYAQVFGQAIGYLIPIVTNGLPRAEGDNQALVVDWREASSLVLRAAGSILPLRYAQVFGQAIGYLIPIVTNGLPRAEGLVPWGLRSLQSYHPRELLMTKPTEIDESNQNFNFFYLWDLSTELMIMAACPESFIISFKH